MATDKEIEVAAKAFLANVFVYNDITARTIANQILTAAEQVRANNPSAMDRVCGVHLNNGRALETVLSADECQRIVDAALGAEQVRASEGPTEAMISAAELKMPELGRLQIRFLFETMMAASRGSHD